MQNQEPPHNLELVYQQLRTEPRALMNDGTNHDAKMATLFAVSTTMAGLIVPLVLIQLRHEWFDEWRCFLTWAAAVPSVIYLIGALVFWQGFQITRYAGMNNPKAADMVLEVDRVTALRALVHQARNLIAENEEVLRSKRKYVNRLFLTTLLQVIATLMWSFAAIGLPYWF